MNIKKVKDKLIELSNIGKVKLIIKFKIYRKKIFILELSFFNFWGNIFVMIS